MRNLLFGLLIMLAAPASAEVIASGPNGFYVRQSVPLIVSQDRAFDAFEQIGRWWESSHTYSGDSANLRLSASPGGCFCERFPGGGGIEHMRVAYADRGKRLILSGSLGPLLYEATSGVMDIKFERIAGGTRVVLDYKVSGFATGGGDKLAPAVDQMLAQQMRRFRESARAQPASR
ncbi:MAG TPA: ATPase [Sphingomicrobium sp.]|jgi:hypothetical protein|nr:ATPase [Sphingomicrobium sp.]